MRRALALVILLAALGGLAIAQPTIVTQNPLPNGSYGQNYFAQLQATTNAQAFFPTLVWSIIGVLQNGLSLNSATGVISGTPTSAGTFTFEITVQEFANQTLIGADSQQFSLTVNSAPPSIVQTSLPVAAQNNAYSATLTATGGAPPYQWSFSALTTNTEGLSIGITTGTITGTPPAAGSFPLTVVVTDSLGVSSQQAFSLFVATQLRILTTSLPNGSLGAPYSQAVMPGGGQPPYAFSLLSGNLPQGLLLSNTGVISGTPTANGTSQFTVQLSDFGKRTAQATFAITIGPGLTIVTTSLPGGALGVAYSQTLTANAGVPPYTWNIMSGSLPPGLALNPSSGAITGTPTTVSSLTFTVQLTDSTGGSASVSLGINIVSPLSITTSSLSPGSVGSAYSQNLAASGGQPPYAWSVSQGTLPSGLTLNAANGTISGTPTTAGAPSFVVSVADSANQTTQVSLALLVATPLTITTSNLTATVGVPFSQTLAATGGTPPYVSWTIASGTPPAGLQFNTQTALLSGTPTAPGSFTITVAVSDSGNQVTSKTLTVTVSAPPVPSVTIGGVPATSPPAQQQPVTVSLSSALPLAVSGTLTLTFVSSVGGDDGLIGFSSGGRTVNFTIAAGQTQAVFSAANVKVLTGTVAGTITLTASLTAGGVNVTPSPAPTATIVTNPTPPVITTVAFQQSTGGFTVIVTGYSTTREVISGLFHFVPASNNTFTQGDITVQLGSAFTTWYQNPASNAFGSEFTLTMPFTVQGNAQAVVAYAVTLTSTKGNSQTVQSNP